MPKETANDGDIRRGGTDEDRGGDGGGGRGVTGRRVRRERVDEESDGSDGAVVVRTI